MYKDIINKLTKENIYAMVLKGDILEIVNYSGIAKV
jgi:hypothetical protein